MTTFRLTFLVTMGALLSSETALANQDPPPSCSSDSSQRMWTTGVRTGGYVINFLWHTIERDCDRLADFETLIYENLDRFDLTGANNDTLCHFGGHVFGIDEALGFVFDQCSASCFQEGEIAGSASAKAYCDLSIALGGLSDADSYLRAPVQLCGSLFQTSCDLTFITSTRSYTDSAGFACEPYTDLGPDVEPAPEGDGIPDYLGPWDAFRNEFCGYHPAP